MGDVQVDGVTHGSNGLTEGAVERMMQEARGRINYI